MDELDEVFANADEPIEQPIQWWQEDKIDALLHLCPYPQWVKTNILRTLPDTQSEADLLIGKLWFDHIPLDPKDQFLKMLKLNTLI